MNLIDKTRGAIVGTALGDALGLGTEFMTRQEAANYYPDGLTSFSQIIRDAHRIQWKRGEWTNDTESLLIFFERILKDGKFDIFSQARAFKDWVLRTDVDVPAVVEVVCRTPGWEDAPVATTHRVWHQRGITEASNEATNRALVTALTSRPDELAENTRKLVLITHDDSRCVATAKIFATLMQSLFFKGEEPDYEVLEEISLRIDPRTTKYLQAARDGNIEHLKIDDPDTLSWTRKSMAAALWGFWHTDNATDAILNVIHLGGDADTNAAISGALAGMKYGYDALPSEKEKIIGLERLLDVADRLADYIQTNLSDMLK